MLRLLLLAMLLANGVFFAWSQGHLLALGLGPNSPSEPQRLAQQIKPEAIKLMGAGTAPNPARNPSAAGASAAIAAGTAAALSPASAASGVAGPPANVDSGAASGSATATSTSTVAIGTTPTTTTAAAVVCVQAGPFDETASKALRIKLEATLPSGSWALERLNQPAQWLVYMGKYPGADAMAKKMAELKGLGVSFEPVPSAVSALAPGLSLGNFANQAVATQALAELTRRGVRTARVVQLSPERKTDLLRLPAADAALLALLDKLGPAVTSRSVKPCPPVDPV
jgi:hypothetical protein